MKAIVLVRQGEIGLRDWPVPLCGDDEIVLEIKAAGICGADLHWESGAYETDKEPFVLGHEFAGVVHQKGARVSDRWQPGDRVVSDNTDYACGKCYSCMSGLFIHCSHRASLGAGLDGGFAKYCKIPANVLQTYPNSLLRIPDNISFEEASLFEPAANAYRATIQEARVLAGEVVVVAGLGPLGLFAVQMAKLAGASRIIAFGMKSDRAVREPVARTFGATDVLASDETDVPAWIVNELGADSVSVMIDCVGAPAIMEGAVRYLTHDSRYVRVGNVKAVYNHTLLPLIDKQITVIGHMGYDAMSWRNVMALAASGQLDLKSMITRTLPLERYPEGYDLMRGQKAAKVVLIP